jgi:O-6-methylguanine DNA methyltransferase
VLARGIQRRQQGAFVVAVALMGLGVASSLLKGLDYEEALIIGCVLLVLLPCHKAFYRRAKLLDERFSPGWVAAIVAVVLLSPGPPDELPSYRATVSGAMEYRAESETPSLLAGGPLEIVLRPATKVNTSIGAWFFVVHGEQIEPLSLSIEIDPSGSVRAIGTVGDWGEEATELEREVLNTLSSIPRGEVRTYAWVARQVGRPKAVRAVGNILANNVVPIVVPCHRVVPTAGGIGNYAFGSAAKRELLKREGVDVDALEALDREGVRYIGSKTTKIVCFPTCKDARRIREENRVPFHTETEALEKGFRPCRRCQPFAKTA